jgi:hypothetical protein
MRCLEKDPKNRFQSVADLANALAPYKNGDVHGSAAFENDPTCQPLPSELSNASASLPTLNGSDSLPTLAESSPLGVQSQPAARATSSLLWWTLLAFATIAVLAGGVLKSRWHHAQSVDEEANLAAEAPSVRTASGGFLPIGASATPASMDGAARALPRPPVASPSTTKAATSKTATGKGRKPKRSGQNVEPGVVNATSTSDDGIPSTRD